jgi:hypothetical protein
MSRRHQKCSGPGSLHSIAHLFPTARNPPCIHRFLHGRMELDRFRYTLIMKIVSPISTLPTHGRGCLDRLCPPINFPVACRPPSSAGPQRTTPLAGLVPVWCYKMYRRCNDAAATACTNPTLLRIPGRRRHRHIHMPRTPDSLQNIYNFSSCRGTRIPLKLCLETFNDLCLLAVIPRYRLYSSTVYLLLMNTSPNTPSVYSKTNISKGKTPRFINISETSQQHFYFSHNKVAWTPDYRIDNSWERLKMC